MSNTLLYLGQVTVVFSLLYTVYRFVLSRLTFHTINRYLLLSLIPISFVFPLIGVFVPPIQIVVDIPLYESIAFNEIENFTLQKTVTPISTLNYWSVLTVLYYLGVGFGLVKLLFSIKKLILIKQNSTIYQKEGYKLILSNSSQIFSFFNWIFIPKEKKDTYDIIILEHEKAHITLKHSIDVMITELYVTFFWFNPLVYFYRKSLKSVHEFQADESVLKKHTKKSDYLQLMLQNLELDTPNSIYSYFNYPILKRRINMMTKSKSNPFTKLTYLLLFPVCVLFFVAFTKPVVKNTLLASTTSIVKINSFPPSLFPIKNKSKADITSFFGVKRNHPKLKETKTHGGIDIRAKTGTPVVATADGTISKASLEGDWGNLIIISHSNNYQTWYAHLNGFNITENQTVKKGDIIGYVGNTGLSTGSHLHYEVKKNGERVNPMDYITE